MAEEPQNPEKKIIVYEDWKSQVAAEKESLRQQEQQQGQQQPQPAGPTAQGPLPEPSLSLLAHSLYLQAAISLGLLPNPLRGKVEANLAQAKHTIDTLEILQQKTTGNRSEEESADIEEMLHQLRLAYISVEEHAAKPA